MERIPGKSQNGQAHSHSNQLSAGFLGTPPMEPQSAHLNERRRNDHRGESCLAKLFLPEATGTSKIPHQVVTVYQAR